MTINETLQTIRRAGKNMGVTRLYHYIKVLNIRPLGEARQRPRQYPADTADQICRHLGIWMVPQYTDADAFPKKKLSAVLSDPRAIIPQQPVAASKRNGRAAGKLVTTKTLTGIASKARRKKK